MSESLTAKRQLEEEHNLDGDVPMEKRFKAESNDEVKSDAQCSEDVEMQDNDASAPTPQDDGNGGALDKQEGGTTKQKKKHDSRRSGRKKDKEPNEGKKPARRRRATRNEEDANKEKNALAAEQGIPKPPRYPKRQSALLIGFCGSGYSGMQIQPEGTKTIEGVLFKALVKVGAVSQDNADNPVKVSLARAARTDAGVHAAGNVVSIKMIVTVPGVSDLVARINEELPPEIRLWGFVRAQNSFNARLICDSRKYTYFFPSYLLIPPKPNSGLDNALKKHAESLSTGSEPIQPHPFWQDCPTSPSKEEDLARKRVWRVGPEPITRLREAAKKYEGTHNFHNFTVSREFHDRSNNRFMKEIRIADPVVYGETEWISVLFHGQSFMLHQRKMIAALVLSCRTGTPSQLISELYEAPDVFVPKMPSLGLLLEEPLFNSYNGRMGMINEKFQPGDADYRPPIDFEIHREKMEDFKEKFIYKNMREIEDRDGLFDAWIRSVDSYSGEDLLYLNPEGKVPPASVIKKGERRNNPFREKRVFDTTSFPGAEQVKKQLEESGDEDEEVIDKKNLAETEG